MIKIDEARTLALNFPTKPRRQLLVDVSTLAQVDAGTGIQRVTRTILRKWLLYPPEGWSIEPVYAAPDALGYRYARRFASRFLGIDEAREDAPVDDWNGNVFVGLDLASHRVLQHKAFFSDLRGRGVAIVFVVYDLLPVLRPDCFHDGEFLVFTNWLRTITRVADGLVCISRATLDDLYNWLYAEQPERQRPLRLGYFHMGADIDSSCPSAGLPGDAGKTLRRLQSRPTFLMVGTVEPRKGHAQTLAAFERLWGKGHDVNLVIVGKQGWMVEALADRLRQHPEARRRLFWLEMASDATLLELYRRSTVLLMASQAEGFGLPLIEAARHRLPIIARDIPVFREVAGDHASYFRGDKPEELAEDILQWLSLHAQGNAPKSDSLDWFTWQQSAKTLEAMLIDESHPQWIHTWQPGTHATTDLAVPQPGRAAHLKIAKPNRGDYTMKKKVAYDMQPVIKVFPENNMQQLKKGVNLIGYVRAEMGVGQGCRGNASAMNAAGIPFTIINFEVGNPARMTDLTWKHKETGDAIYNTNLFHVNADQTPVILKYIDGAIWKNRYNIGHWTWELPEFPDEWCSAFKYFNEIWVPSEFVRESVVKKSPLPVVRMPYPIEDPQVSEQFNRLHFGIPEAKFLFLAMYDVHSVHARKNPGAAIQAFIKAFFGDSQVGLVIKVNNGKSNPYEVQQLQMIARKCNNVFILDKVLSRIEINSLINSVDCFISLHRSEGFGLVIAEAMCLGKPVIATNWSGNVDFMSKKNSCPVNYKLIELTESYGPYKKGQYWAEPDIEHAKYYMQKIFKSNSYRCSIGAEAKEYVRTNLSPLTVGKMIYQRLVDIQRL
jgi:glycosyltransferase involved in cell wall biosynthesis